MSLTEKLTREVIEIVAGIAELEPAEVSAVSTLEQLGLDSLDGLRIVAAVEKRYGVVVDEARIAQIRTMPDVLALVREFAAEVK